MYLYFKVENSLYFSIKKIRLTFNFLNLNLKIADKIYHEIFFVVEKKKKYFISITKFNFDEI